jgi:hypothetical protein
MRYNTLAEVKVDFEIHVIYPIAFNMKDRVVNLMLQGTLPNGDAKVYKVDDPEVNIPAAVIIAEANKQRPA